MFALVAPLAYALLIWWKGSLHVYDAVVLTLMYAAYLVMLTKLPPEGREGVEDLERIPRAIVMAPRVWRTVAIVGFFLAGGLLIYFTAEPFLGSLIALAGAIGIPSFIMVQWLAPVVSEFPELASTFYFARQPEKAAVALMNIVSSNINQWTLLVAMLPIVYSMGGGHISRDHLRCRTGNRVAADNRSEPGCIGVPVQYEIPLVGGNGLVRALCGAGRLRHFRVRRRGNGVPRTPRSPLGHHGLSDLVRHYYRHDDRAGGDCRRQSPTFKIPGAPTSALQLRNSRLSYTGACRAD